MQSVWKSLETRKLKLKLRHGGKLYPDLDVFIRLSRPPGRTRCHGPPPLLTQSYHLAISSACLRKQPDRRQDE